MGENLVSNTQHIVSAYDSELKEIVNDILKMADLLLEMMNYSRKALDNPSQKLVDDARELDKKINDLDVGLHQKAIKILALRQPMAVDLRFLTSTLKIASSLERIGDLAKASCKKAGKFTNITSLEVNNDLKEMNALATKMLNDVIFAFRDMSIDKAIIVLDEDNDVDQAYHKLLADVQSLVKSKPEAIPAFADIITAAKNFERIGDHCSKIADHVHYISTGKFVAKVKKAERKEALKKEKKS